MLRAIRRYNGVITAFDGDRVMAVFYGERMNSNAAMCALYAHYLIRNIVNPLIKERYSDSTYSIKYAIGIDRSEIHAIRTGIRNNNDLAWIGTAANYAAKLSGLREDGYCSYITKPVYDIMSDDCKIAKDGRQMWEQRNWQSRTIFRSNFFWDVDA